MYTRPFSHVQRVWVQGFGATSATPISPTPILPTNGKTVPENSNTLIDTEKKGPKHTHLFEGPTIPLFTYVDIDITHMITGLLPPFLQMVSDQKLDGGKAWELCYIWCTLSEQLLLLHGAGLVFNLRA